MLLYIVSYRYLRLPAGYLQATYGHLRPPAGVLKTKITKIVTHFGASMYAYAESLEARQAMEARLRMQALELRDLVAASRQQRQRYGLHG